MTVSTTNPSSQHSDELIAILNSLPFKSGGTRGCRSLEQWYLSFLAGAKLWSFTEDRRCGYVVVRVGSSQSYKLLEDSSQLQEVIDEVLRTDPDEDFTPVDAATARPRTPPPSPPAPRPTPSPSVTVEPPAPPTPRGPTVYLSEIDNGQTVQVNKGYYVELTLQNQYWQIEVSSNEHVLHTYGPETYATLPQCGTPGDPNFIPGTGCGTATRTYKAINLGTATLKAHRDACGEALECRPDQATYNVTVVVVR